MDPKNEKYYSLSSILNAFHTIDSDWLGAYTEQEIKKKLEEINPVSRIRTGQMNWLPKMITFGGKTVHDTDEHYGYVYICDICGFEQIGRTKFCPSCGFKSNQ